MKTHMALKEWFQNLKRPQTQAAPPAREPSAAILGRARRTDITLTPPQEKERDEYIAFHNRRYDFTIEQILRRVAPGARVLSIGSEPNHVELLAWHFLGVQPTGTCYAPDDARFSWNVTFELDAKRLEFPMHGIEFPRGKVPAEDATFDAAFLFEVLEHLAEDPAPLLAEVRRALKPGAPVLVSTPNLQHVHRVLYMLDGRGYPDMEYNPGPGVRHQRVYTMLELTERLEKAGFAVEERIFLNAWDLIPESELNRYRASAPHAAVLKALDAPCYQADSLFVVARKT
jgi:SAM-dependent methyltransferase